MLFTILAAISLVIWIYILFGRGAFWRISRAILPIADAAPPARNIVAIVPARNEAETIARAVRSLLDQSVPLNVIVVDDSSIDSTAEIARAAAAAIHSSHRFTAIQAKPLISGWTGKLWALSQGLSHALTENPDYVLFTDADIVHERDSVRHLLAISEKKSCDLTSLMVKLTCDSLAERALIPAFVFFFLKLYPPAWIANAKAKTAGAAGGCMLIKPAALARIGGLAAIRHQVIDDCSLATAIKRSGGTIWMGLTNETRSIRPYGSGAEIGRMIARSAFSQLRHSFWLLLATVLALLLIYVIPVVALCAGNRTAALAGVTAWLAMTICYWPTVRFYRLAWAWAVCLPLIALFYLGATVYSALLYWNGRGGGWKGRTQDVRN